MRGILWQLPGQKALANGTYDLVGEHGKSAHRSTLCVKGELLPLVKVGDDLGVVHWVLVDESTDALAA